MLWSRAPVLVMAPTHTCKHDSLARILEIQGVFPANHAGGMYLQLTQVLEGVASRIRLVGMTPLAEEILAVR